MKTPTLLLFAIIVQALYGSQAGADEAAPTVCLLQDPPNQCGKFCLTALMPLIDHIALHQQQWNTRDAITVNETLAKLNRIEGGQTALQDTLGKRLPQDLEERLENMRSQQEALGNQILAMQKTLSKIEKGMILRNFERFGSKHFYIERNIKRNWTLAINTCTQMGGHLASIQDSSEFSAITANLKEDFSYRVDINDLAVKGQFMSYTSGKPAAFLKWKPGEPKYNHEAQRCVTINNGGMWVDSCKDDMLFICQANDEEE